MKIYVLNFCCSSHLNSIPVTVFIKSKYPVTLKIINVEIFHIRVNLEYPLGWPVPQPVEAPKLTMPYWSHGPSSPSHCREDPLSPCAMVHNVLGRAIQQYLASPRPLIPSRAHIRLTDNVAVTFPGQERIFKSYSLSIGERQVMSIENIFFSQGQYFF